MYCGCIMYLQNVYVQRFIPNGSSVTALCVSVCLCVYSEWEFLLYFHIDFFFILWNHKWFNLTIRWVLFRPSISHIVIMIVYFQHHLIAMITHCGWLKHAGIPSQLLPFLLMTHHPTITASTKWKTNYGRYINTGASELHNQFVC